MKKKVNGKIIEIKNIELFEKAAESIAINRYVTNSTLDFDSADISKAKVYIALYNAFYKALPFPLYAIDSNLKYAVIGTFIKKSCAIEHTMWVDGGLIILLDNERKIGIGFINNTWAFIRVDRVIEDNTDLRKYEKDIGYEDLKWALERILKRENTADYYNVFMPEFVEACNNQPMVLKWELSNILEFGRVPNNTVFKPNVIVDWNSGREYTIDIYVAAVKEAESNKYSLSLDPDDDADFTAVKKHVKYFQYDVYSKESTENEANPKPEKDRMQKCKFFGAMNLYNSLFKIKTAKESNTFDQFTGFIVGKDMVYCISNRLFLASSEKFADPKEIARGVELIGFERDMFYFVKPKMVSSKVCKETVYSYSLRDNNLRLCKIRFVNK